MAPGSRRHASPSSRRATTCCPKSAVGAWQLQAPLLVSVRSAIRCAALQRAPARPPGRPRWERCRQALGRRGHKCGRTPGVSEAPSRAHPRRRGMSHPAHRSPLAISVPGQVAHTISCMCARALHCTLSDPNHHSSAALRLASQALGSDATHVRDTPRPHSRRAVRCALCSMHTRARHDARSEHVRHARCHSVAQHGAPTARGCCAGCPAPCLHPCKRARTAGATHHSARTTRACWSRASSTCLRQPRLVARAPQ